MLQLRGITKSYGTRRVLDDIAFDVAPGRLTGFVGGNGAGKTTTMRIMLGVLGRDGGEVTLNGSPVTSADRRRFGYMPEERGLYPKMKVLEHIVYLARLHGFSKTDATTRATALLEELGLGERLGDNVETLSLGNQQRAQIAAALVHDPEVLILDEPFSGLDPLAVDVVANVLQTRAAQGTSVLFSSHQLDVVERLCDDLVIIAGGTIRAAGSRDALREQHATRRYELVSATDAGWLREEPGIEVIDFDGGYAVFEADSDDTVQRVLQRAVAAGDVTSFAPRRPTLAQIFTEVIQ
ncbi:ATP-binding cassette domain-containing protein [Microbacterium sp. EYE_5]|uniref:ABC transporter ATP-binding protein n=1 Tax=unclassified Microbacterium TaxID=2609290 RepID=UPI002004D494|nr:MULTISPECIES: ATP-binding cassette domain-containing protein [unclassified Microbacterium]MCK6079335.1 ATP-binding cassette domain-containing protein [Microbacterium sp. EYE_382]MCK6084605.1 ATP-binding cassette domain-containing protein [Microbacterium sp. EYE_384]MCK6123166.1 ATP-binding cassette domain-containing protein [Microbacterium sp. EYE_80]MCK6125369.1 ATP-binding cassette domain-containing protein [Microbacterium sp. EYE_79]MCK6140289.1 ATP-binding cassette domain-containing pro